MSAIATLPFDENLRRFQQQVGAYRAGALILMGTRQPITAALLIGALQPERVAFLLTAETRDLPQQVAGLLHISGDDWLAPAEDHKTVIAVYGAIKRLMRAWDDVPRPAIAVDVTAGTKQMSVGIAKAAHLLNLTTVYVASQFQGNQPIPGSQSIEVLPDPYVVFGDLEAAEARRLYAAHDYLGAQRIFAALAARVPQPDGARYAALADLAAMYAAWDVLDFATAARHAAALAAHEPAQLPVLGDGRATLAEQQRALVRLAEVASAVVRRGDEALRTLADPDALLPLLGALHTNALRRAAQGRYDFAALFRYRCLELIGQHRLASHGLLTSRADYRALALPKAQLSQAFQACQRAIGRKQPRGLPDRITLFDGYLLLAALDDPLVRDYPIARIEERSDARNQSVLAHGYRLIDQGGYARFAEVVDEMIDRLFARVLDRPRAAWERAAMFVDLFAR
ncbi:MAG: TIGR02710 family CRISPR-associated protein [Kouleothrix sp.]|nr:TIGR02710 family CRISPR-associated protein [Kouleothrix sp.]